MLHDTADKYYRPAATGWNGDQLWTASAVSAASYTAPTTTAPNPVNKIDVSLIPQNRLGELGLSGVTNVATTKVATSYNDLNSSAAFAMTFTKSDGKINSGIFWLDLGSATGKTYSLNFMPFTFTPFDVASGAGTPGALALGTANTPLALTGFTNASKWSWNDSASGFAFAWSRPNAANAANNDVVIDFFDATGALKNQQTITGLGSQVTWGLADDLNDSTTNGTGFFLYTVDNASATVSLANKYDKTGLPVTGFTPLSFRTLFDIGGIKASNFIYNTYDATTSTYQNVAFAISGLRGGKNVIDFYKTDANLVPQVTQEIALTGAVVNNVIQSVRLSNSLKTLFAYEDGTNLHLTELGTDGAFIQDTTVNLGANAVFDRLRSLNNGLVEIEFRTPGTLANTTLVNTQIFDTRTGLTSLTGQFVAGQTGVAVNTTVDNAVVIAKANETITNTGKNGTISYEDSSAAVNVALDASLTTAAVTSGGDAAGDVIKGFVNVIGSQFADTLTGGGGSILIGGGGNDVFVFSAPGSSLVGNFDTISDFGVSGADSIKVGKTFTNANFKTVSHVSTGNLATDLAATLLASAPGTSTTAIQFAAASAALVTLGGPASDAGTYVVVNNHTTAGFLATADKVIKLQDGATVTSSSFVA